VYDPHQVSREQRVLLSLAIGLFLTHASLLFFASHISAISLLSNLCELSCALLATVACLAASRRSQYFAEHFWLLFAAGCGIWSLAQLLETYYESILHVPLQQPWPSDVIFFLSMALLAMTLFIDQERGFDWKQWPRIFDLLQVLILTLAVYLFTFDTPAAWANGWGKLATLAWVPDTARDATLLAAFAIAALWGANKQSRTLYARMAIFFLAYLCGEFPYLYLQSNLKVRTGTLWDLCWSVPFLLAASLAATSQPLALASPSRAASEKAFRRRGRWNMVHVASLLFPLIILLMAAGVAEKQLLLAAIFVTLSFACSIARILFSEQQQLDAAKALEERNALLKSMFEGTGDALFIKDLNGHYVIVNEAFASLMNVPAEQLVGKGAAEFLDAGDVRMFAEEDRIVIASGKSHVFRSRINYNDPKRTLLLTKAPWRDPDGHIVGILGSLRDITEYQKMEERLQQSQKMEAIGTLAGGVAHDFNNLLMVINGYSAVLSEALSNDPKLRNCADQILKAGDRAASLTKQLLAFSRKQTIQPTVLNLNQVISGVEKLLHRLIGENIVISTQLEPGLGAVLADSGQLEQVILNLAVNARDAMPDGGRLIFETRNLEMTDAAASANNLLPGRYVEFVVKDTGVGMDLNVQSRLFEPFFTTKPAGKGTGLGLSTIYGILKQSNGHIAFASQPGCGTTFHIYLPRIDSAQPAPASKGERPARLTGHETVLLVEDDASVRDLIQSVLSTQGYTVLIPKTPQKAEELFEAHRGQIDLLISDVVMPEIRGTELAARLTAKNPELKVMLMSGYIEDSATREGIRGGDVVFLQKPFAPLALARKVRQILSGLPVSDS
jgi:PAS domain S-box-containing protein